MLCYFLLCPLLLAPLLSLATPVALSPRQASSSCLTEFEGGFDTAANFTLAAYNTTLPNANTTGVPIVVAPILVVGEFSLQVFTTLASSPTNHLSYFSMNGGILTPNGNPSVPEAVGLSFSNVPVFGSGVNPATEAQIYCGVASTDPAGGGIRNPFLAVFGAMNLFSLCPSLFGPSVHVVFNASTTSSGCYPVLLQMIGLD